jgi:SAM-dependent methyltransferase
MNGKIPVFYHYFDESGNKNYLLQIERKVSQITHNTIKTYNTAFKLLDKKDFKYYGEEANSFYDVLWKYPLSGKTVIVWGLLGCNCNIIALWNNAQKVIVVDYNKPQCDHEKIVVLSHEELKAQRFEADAAFSYSSFEHDGFGRYGNLIVPDGDLQAMQDAHRHLKKDGILFLGVPMGKDSLVWNDARIYGKLRLPLLLKDYQLLDVFDPYKTITPEYPFRQNGMNTYPAT